ncbi:unnamed protein product, partial [Mesorhabditis belari]|uniref:Uncharacterized protein n=1 Tax=Mesorhabditis belari TaxID=2138241 RepID=A0AAF3E8T7_9BILA
MRFSLLFLFQIVISKQTNADTIDVKQSELTGSILESTMKSCEQNSSKCLPPLIPRRPLWLISELHKVAMCQLPSILSPLLDRTFCLLNLPFVGGQPDTSSLARQICALSPTYSFTIKNASHFFAEDWEIETTIKPIEENTQEITKPFVSQDDNGNPRISRPASSALYSKPSTLATQSKPTQAALKSSPSDSARRSRPSNSSTFSKPSPLATNEKPSLSATRSEVSSDARFSKPSQQGMLSLPEFAAYRSNPSPESTRSLPLTPSSFSLPSKESTFSMPHGNVSFSLPSPIIFYSKPTISILFSSPSGSAYFAKTNEKEIPSKEILYSKAINSMRDSPKFESLKSTPEKEALNGKPMNENVFSQPKSSSISSKPNVFNSETTQEGVEKKINFPAKAQTEWTFLAAVQEPFSRFILNWWSQCVKPATLGEKSCYGCRENISCLLETIHQKALLILTEDISNFEKDSVIGYFLPQNWQCDFARFPYHIIEYSTVGEVVSYVEKAIQSIIELTTQRQSSSALLISDPLRDTTFSDFNEKLSFLLSSPNLLESIIRIYYHDFVLFGFHGYFTNGKGG